MFNINTCIIGMSGYITLALMFVLNIYPSVRFWWSICNTVWLNLMLIRSHLNLVIHFSQTCNHTKFTKEFYSIITLLRVWVQSWDNNPNIFFHVTECSSTHCFCIIQYTTIKAHQCCRYAIAGHTLCMSEASNVMLP